MVRYYKVSIYRATATKVAISLYTRQDSDPTWNLQKTEYTCGFNRAQELAEQWQLQYNVTDYAWEVSVDTRGAKND